jgi:RNA polymerase sigma factor (sigma-70 family)
MIDAEKLLKKHDSFLRRLSRRFHVNGYTQEDFYQEFAMVLIDCSKKFDKTRKTRFTTYLYKSIMARAYQIIRKEKNDMLSLDKVLSGSNTEFLELIESEEKPPDLLDLEYERNEFILNAVKDMPRGDVTYRVIVNNETLESIGKDLGLTKTRIWQIHQDNMKHLRRVYAKFLDGE